MIPFMTADPASIAPNAEAEVPQAEQSGEGIPFLSVMSESDLANIPTLPNGAVLDLVTAKPDEPAMPDAMSVAPATPSVTQDVAPRDRVAATPLPVAAEPRNRAPQATPEQPVDVKPATSQSLVTPAQRMIEGAIAAMPKSVEKVPKGDISGPSTATRQTAPLGVASAPIGTPHAAATPPAMKDIANFTPRRNRAPAPAIASAQSTDASRNSAVQMPAPPAVSAFMGKLANIGNFAHEFDRINLVAEADLGGLTSTQDRATPTASAAASPTTPPQLARHAAQQIAAAIAQGPGGATEIALNPEELGRVRLALTATETTINLAVLADRPETNDLLRRHIEALAQEFRALGYDTISFSFGENHQQQTADDTHAADENGPIPETMGTDKAEGPQTGSNTGLDLRL